MTFIAFIQTAAIDSIHKLYGQAIEANDFQVSLTKPEFTGDYTIVFFPLLKKLRKKPDELGNELGKAIVDSHADYFSGFNVIKGFLNLTLTDDSMFQFLGQHCTSEKFGLRKPNGKTVMVEYSSPNTNKPLHLGHLRNIFLGWSMTEILQANGFRVVKSCIVNNRGIHICKSMIAWQLFANGATPESTGIKGDHFVGDYYVKFNDEYQRQIASLVAGGMDKKQAEKEAPIMKEAQQMLVRWEEGDADVRNLWSKMNSWVYKGFDETYRQLGVSFDKVYYESDTYLLGKEYVQEGLQKGVLFAKDDGSIWIDLQQEGLDEKLLMRGDGTSVYITQDIGLAVQKYEQYALEKSIYVIGDEQIYHMKVLKEICRKLGFPFAEGIYHLSYGMVELTTGKMKSREGTVVDADDMIEEMKSTAEEKTRELGKVEGSGEDELKKLYAILGLGAIKFFLLRVNPKKRMIFNPADSIDFQGFTGPFVQYTYARIQSILRKTGVDATSFALATQPGDSLLPLEKSLVLTLESFETVIGDSAAEMDPSLIANYVFSLAKLFNSFYTEHSVLHAENERKKQLRIALSLMTGNVIKSSLSLLGIQVPDRM